MVKAHRNTPSLLAKKLRNQNEKFTHVSTAADCSADSRVDGEQGDARAFGWASFPGLVLSDKFKAANAPQRDRS